MVFVFSIDPGNPLRSLRMPLEMVSYLMQSCVLILIGVPIYRPLCLLFLLRQLIAELLQFSMVLIPLVLFVPSRKDGSICVFARNFLVVDPSVSSVRLLPKCIRRISLFPTAVVFVCKNAVRLEPCVVREARRLCSFKPLKVISEAKRSLLPEAA